MLLASYFCLEEGICPTSESWPRQPRHGSIHQKKWQSFIDTLCEAPTFKLKQPLGQWYRLTQYKWHTYYDPTLCLVILETEQEWKHYSQIRQQRRQWHIDKNQRVTDTTPPHQIDPLIPMDIIRNNRDVAILTPPQAVVDCPTIKKRASTWHHYLDTIQV